MAVSIRRDGESVAVGPLTFLRRENLALVAEVGAAHSAAQMPDLLREMLGRGVIARALRMHGPCLALVRSHSSAEHPQNVSRLGPVILAPRQHALAPMCGTTECVWQGNGEAPVQRHVWHRLRT